MKLRSILVLAMSMLMALFLAGCDEQQSQGTATDSRQAVSSSREADSGSSQAVDKSETMNIKVYYPDENATGLVAVGKTIKATESEKYQAAVEALLAGTDQKGLTTVFPKNTKVLKVSVKGKTAQVDFDKSLKKGFAGGSTGEELLVGSVVNTLTEFSEIQEVQILVGGQEIETLSGHMELSQPLSRMENLIK